MGFSVVCAQKMYLAIYLLRKAAVVETISIQRERKMVSGRNRCNKGGQVKVVLGTKGKKTKKPFSMS